MRKERVLVNNNNISNNNNVIKEGNKLRKGLWSPEEDEKLIKYMLIRNGKGCWSDIARNADLQRCGKSCRLRWINYLRPDHHKKRTSSFISIPFLATGRTDNEIKNFWNSTLKKRLKNNPNVSTSSPNDSNSSEARDGIGGIMSMSMPMHNEHDIMTMCMCMDSSSSSSVSHLIDPFSMLDTHYVPSSIAQVGHHIGDGLFYGDYGILEPSKMGLEGDLIYNHNHNSCFNNTIEQGIKKGDMFRLENNWQGENLRVGGCDFEGLFDNISSFPFHDFQVE
uniref:MYB protein n=1 Tax=Zanthoxylum bungeanum TaxID=328401 RepID=A0A8X8MEW6_9ROSI|nr:MYB protein [Zanthoxylum bungeanum]